MKDVLRKQILAIREAIPDKDREWMDKQICDHLRLCDAFVNARRVMFYLPIKNEVDVTALMQNPRVEKLLPFVKDDRLHASAITDLDDVEPGPYGTLEPKTKSVEEYVDVIIVPGLVFDKKRNRIGYGKGYYDKLLSYTAAVKIGVAYQSQILDHVPIEPHDIPMDMIITENGII